MLAPVHPPKCEGGHLASLVCLNSGCQQYPFFCTDCPENCCEITHQHGSKLQSISFKEIWKRVQKGPIIHEDLSSAIQRYRQCLRELQMSIDNFIEAQLLELSEIEKGFVEPEVSEVIDKLRAQKYKDLTGSQLDALWQNLGRPAEPRPQEKEAIIFIKQKEDELREIDKIFQTLGSAKFDIDTESECELPATNSKAEKIGNGGKQEGVQKSAEIESQAQKKAAQGQPSKSSKQ